jgi:hypothetical protein
LLVRQFRPHFLAELQKATSAFTLGTLCSHSGIRPKFEREATRFEKIRFCFQQNGCNPSGIRFLFEINLTTSGGRNSPDHQATSPEVF